MAAGEEVQAIENKVLRRLAVNSIARLDGLASNIFALLREPLLHLVQVWLRHIPLHQATVPANADAEFSKRKKTDWQ